MANYTIDVLTAGIEQGSISSSGNTSDSQKVRSTGYLQFIGDDDRTVTMTATATTGKIIQVDLLGYTSSATTSPSFDLYWYDSPHDFNISSYSNVTYFRVVLKYKDGSTLVPEEVASCVIECNYTYPWYMDGDQPMPIGALPILQERVTEPYPASLWRYEGGNTPVNALMAPILQERVTKPYPATLWRIDESNDGAPYHELMPDILYVEPEPPPPPEPGYEEETVVQYDIYCDDKLMHSSVVPENEYKVIDPVLDLQDSAAGSLEFSLPPFNCMYGKCQMVMSTIRVERNGKEIWEGRPVSFKEDMWLNHAITCEGELAYMNDIYQVQNKYDVVTLQQLIYAIIGVTDGHIDASKGYNQRAADNRKFNVTSIESAKYGDNEPITVTIPFQSTLETINSICKTYGLHVYIDNRWDETTGEKIRGLRFTDDSGLGENSTQKIEFGTNLTDYAKSYNFAEIVTAVLPLGAKSDKAGSVEKDADETVDVKASGFEQGTIQSDGGNSEPGDTNHTKRVRTANYLSLPSGADSIKVIAELTPISGVATNVAIVGYDANKGRTFNTNWYESEHVFNVSNESSTKFYRVVLRYDNDADVTPSSVVSCSAYISKEKKGEIYPGAHDGHGRGLVIWPTRSKDNNGNWHEAGEIVDIVEEDISIFDTTEPDFSRDRYFVKQFILTEEQSTVFITNQQKMGAGMLVVENQNNKYNLKKAKGGNVPTAWTDMKFNGWYTQFEGLVKMYVGGYDTTATSGYPTGAIVYNSKVVDKGLEDYVNVQSVNNGDYFVIDNDRSFYENEVLPVEIYGRIERKMEWSDAKDAWVLYNNALAYLRSGQFDGLEISLSAIDMAMLGVDCRQIRVGESVMVKCQPYGLEKVMPVSQVKIPLSKPEDTQFVVGDRRKQSLTSVNNSTNSELLSLIAEKPSLSTVMSAAKSSTAEYLKDTQNGYVTFKYSDDGHIEAILVSDTQDYRETSKGYWIFGKHGIGFVPISGDPNDPLIAMKDTGELVADRILSGTMYADRILGGSLRLGGYTGGEQEDPLAMGVEKVYDANGNLIAQIDKDGIKQWSGNSWVNIYNGQVNFGTGNNAGAFIKGNGSLAEPFTGVDAIEVYGGTPGDPMSANTAFCIATRHVGVWVEDLWIGNVQYTGYLEALEDTRIQSGNTKYIFDKGILVGTEPASGSLASDTFDTADGKRVTVSDGLITSIVNIPSNNS